MVLLNDYRSSLQPRGRGRANRRFAPYRQPERQSYPDRFESGRFETGRATGGRFTNEGLFAPHWDRPRPEPLPPGESRPPPRFGPSDSSKIRCYACLKYGHKSPQCPEKAGWLNFIFVLIEGILFFKNKIGKCILYKLFLFFLYLVFYNDRDKKGKGGKNVRNT